MDFVTTQCMADARSVAYKPKLIAVQLYISASQVNNPFLTLYIPSEFHCRHIWRRHTAVY